MTNKQEIVEGWLIRTGQKRPAAMSEPSEKKTSGSKQALVSGWLVRGQKTYLYIDSPEKPRFVVINGDDPVVSIEPRYARSEPDEASRRPTTANQERVKPDMELVGWGQVMELAEKHGSGWEERHGWAFKNDDDLYYFAQDIAAIAKSSQ